MAKATQLWFVCVPIVGQSELVWHHLLRPHSYMLLYVMEGRPGWANFFFGRGFNLEIFLNLQGSEFIQTLLLIYNHLAKFVVYKSWTRSALLKGTSKCFLVSSITCRNEEAIEWVWFEYKLSFVVKLSTKPHPQTGSLH